MAKAGSPPSWHGWVGINPADVAKVMRQEIADWIKDTTNPVDEPVNKALFGGWEGNWMGYNTAHELVLPNSRQESSASLCTRWPRTLPEDSTPRRPTVVNVKVTSTLRE